MKFWCLIWFSCMCFSQENIKISDLQNNNDFVGQIKRIENFPSKYVATRKVDVWLPNRILKPKNIKCYTCTMDKCFLMRKPLGTNKNGA